MKKYLLAFSALTLITTLSACKPTAPSPLPTATPKTKESPSPQLTTSTSPTSVTPEPTLAPSSDEDIKKLDQLFNGLKEDDFKEDDLSDQNMGNQ